jgi:hypothetical protein
VPEPDPLAASRYSCVYWIDHLYNSKPKSWADASGDFKVTDTVDEFVRKRYLYWLEGLSLCRSIGIGVVLMAKLCSLVQVWHARITHCIMNANSSRRCKTIILLSLFKMPADSSCTTKG